MFDDDWFKRRKKHFPYDNIFDELEKMERIMWRILENFFSERNLEFKNLNKPFVYGFSISIGPNGQPVIREFGNIKSNLNQTFIKEEIEPLIDVIEEEESIKIYVELPGVKKENIKLRVKSNKLIISVLNEDKKYHKEISLPPNIEVKNIKATYRNGVLEIIIKKKKQSTKRTNIKIN